MMRRIFVFILLITISSGCATKLEKARTNITRTWQISAVFENGLDVTVAFLQSRADYRIDFNNGGDFVETYFPFSGGLLTTVPGTWVFSDGINKITLTDNNQTRVYQIERLDEEHLNITDLGSNNNTELQMVPD